MYKKTTNSIEVTVTPLYLDDRSSPEVSYFVWAYNVQIENKGTETVQLLNRYWNITDSNGMVQEVRGPGVVGEQPVLKPGEAYEYASGTHLTTSSGVMYGSYEMIDKHGDKFDIEIPAFSLDSDDGAMSVN